MILALYGGAVNEGFAQPALYAAGMSLVP